MKYKKQIGIIVPSSSVVTEMMFHRYIPPNIGVATSRVKFHTISFQGLSNMMDLVEQAAQDVCCVEPDLIVFCSIMAGAINGKVIANIVEQSTGTPCITGFFAMLEAINALGICHPAVISPHTEELDIIFRRKMLQNGVEIGNIYRLESLPDGERSISKMEQIDVESIMSMAERIDLSQADALIVNAACIQGADYIREMEDRLQMPVLQGDQVSLWSALRTVQDRTDIPNLGRLFKV